MHGSKGLEFPVVLVPYAWDSWRPLARPRCCSCTTRDQQRVLDVGGRDGPGYDERRKAAEAEDSGEELRLLYVALTRAQCAVVAWWAPSSGTAGSALNRLLLGRSGRDRDTSPVKVPEDDAALARLTAWGWPDEVDVVAGRAAAVAALEPARRRRAPSSSPRASTGCSTRPGGAPPTPALTAAAHDAGPAAGSEPEVPARGDEPVAPVDGRARRRPTGCPAR